MKDIGKRIKEARLSLGLTASEAADAIGIGRHSWERYEREGNEPKASCIAFLVSKGIDANWLFTGLGTMTGENNTPEHTAFPTHKTKRESPINREFFELIINELSKLYDYLDINKPSNSLSLTATDIYNNICEETENLLEQKLALKVALKQLQTDIAATK